MATGTVKWFNNAKGFGLFARKVKTEIFSLITQPFRWTDTVHSKPVNRFLIRWSKVLRDTTRAVLCQSRDNQQNSGLIATLACFGNLQSTKAQLGGFCFGV